MLDFEFGPGGQGSEMEDGRSEMGAFKYRLGRGRCPERPATYKPIGRLGTFAPTKPWVTLPRGQAGLRERESEREGEFRILNA